MRRTLLILFLPLLVFFHSALANASQTCVETLKSLPVQEQFACLNDFNYTLPSWENKLATAIRNFDARTDHQVAAAAFDAVRRSGSTSAELAEAISFQLQHQAPLYQERDKWHVLRLRAYAFVTLAEIGVPASALPMLTDTLMYVDERMQSVEFGAALRAAASLGTTSRLYIPGILQLYAQRFAEEEFSLEHYATDFSKDHATTVQIEATRALGQIALPVDENALGILQTIVKLGPAMDSRLVLAANEALTQINSRKENKTDAPAITSLSQENIQVSIADLQSIRFEDQQGRQSHLGDAINKPTLLTFFYSRCQNDGKCSTTIAKLAHLQKQLAESGMHNEVKIIAATFEPQFDSSERLRRYAIDRGFQFNGNAAVIRFDDDSHKKMIENLNIAVGYNAGWVNSHGVELVLLDSAGRLAQRYEVEMWDNTVVLEDITALLSRNIAQAN